jgi:hypothetical protein
MAPAHHVFLIPGFFGFANLGQITYFGHVRRALAAALAARGVSARVHVVRTAPTASLPARAARLAGAIAAHGAGNGPVHLVGHSSGGLDARLLVSPGVRLPGVRDPARAAARVRSIVTVATPHHGTPVAAFFATLRGQRLLQLLSLGTMHLLHLGQLPLGALLRAAGAFARVDGVALERGLADELFARLLADFSVGRRRAVAGLLREVARDQALLLQLTPEAMAVFDAAVATPPRVRRGSVVTWARRPSLRSRMATGLDPAGQLSRALYGALHGLAAGRPGAAGAPLAPAHARALVLAYGREPDARASDGIVPTRSQPYGQVLAAVRADHLDVLGHFADPSADPPHVDWLATGTGFDRAAFDAVWRRVARFLADAGAT